MSEKQNYALQSACASHNSTDTLTHQTELCDGGVALNQHRGFVWARYVNVKIAPIIEMIFNVL